jgi:hypothetical protein
MAYETNRFCWHGAVTTDVEKTTAFYSETLGFDTQKVQMGPDEATMFAAAGTPLAHVAPPQMEGVPNHWHSYLRVDDVDASARVAADKGGKVLVPPTDIPPGRFSVVTSPSGAAVSLFHESDPSAAHHPGGEGGVHWVELHSKDLERDVAWLEAVFGFEVSKMAMPDGTDYRILNAGGKQRGGAMNAQADAPAAMWLVWFHVADVEQALARAERNGGRTIAPVMEVPGVGRLAIFMDPVGAVAGIITPA